MILLAVETSASLGSVAVGRVDGDLSILARRFLDRQGEHGSRLVPAIGEVLTEAGIRDRSPDGVVVGAGPGSFTGLRVAAATAKGLVRALNAPLYAVSSLAAGAVTAGLDLRELEAPVVDFRDSHRPRYVLIDARGDRIYGGCYRVRDDRIDSVVAPHGGTLEDALLVSPPSDSLFVGSGARKHAARIMEAGFPVLSGPAGDPVADSLLRIVAGDPEPHRVDDPARWEPEYLRDWRPGWDREAG